MMPESSTPQEKELWQDKTADLITVVKVGSKYVKFNRIGERRLEDLDPRLDDTLTKDEFLSKYTLVF